MKGSAFSVSQKCNLPLTDDNYSRAFTAPNAAHGTKDGKTVPTSSGQLETWNRLQQTPSSFPTLCPRPSETERAPSIPDRAAIKRDSLDNKDDKERYVPAILRFQDQEDLDRILSVSIHFNDSCSVSMPCASPKVCDQVAAIFAKWALSSGKIFKLGTSKESCTSRATVIEQLGMLTDCFLQLCRPPWCVSGANCLNQGCPFLLLEGHRPAEFSFSFNEMPKPAN